MFYPCSTETVNELQQSNQNAGQVIMAQSRPGWKKVQNPYI